MSLPRAIPGGWMADPDASNPSAVADPANPTTTTTPAAACLCPQCGHDVSRLAAQRRDYRTDHDDGDGADDKETLLQKAHQHIEDLEAQVRILNEKAAAAADRSADYEDELAQLRRQVAEANNSHPNTLSVSPARSSFLPTGAANRISALLSPRNARSSPNLKADSSAAAPAPAAAAASLSPASTAVLPTPPPSATATAYSHSNTSSYSSGTTSASAASASSATTSPPVPPLPSSMSSVSSAAASYGQHHGLAPAVSGPSTQDLMHALAREQALRRAAEGRLQETNREIEELSVSLFEQANEMVAEERRARARLEQRVAILEQRDTEKKRRLERLDAAMVRIERVRTLLGATEEWAEGEARRQARRQEREKRVSAIPVNGTSDINGTVNGNVDQGNYADHVDLDDHDSYDSSDDDLQSASEYPLHEYTEGHGSEDETDNNKTPTAAAPSSTMVPATA